MNSSGGQPTEHSLSGTVIESKEVTWSVLDIPVSGTLTSPKNGPADSAVVLLAGSGPTDRNWCSPILKGDNGSGRLLAELLADRGFVTLRYDKLGSGPHIKENLPKLSGKVSMQTYVDELAGGVTTLVSEMGGGKKTLFALANSEGCIHAVNYQLRAGSKRFDGLVLAGAPGRTVGDVARSQIQSQLNSLEKKRMTAKLLRLLRLLPDTESFMLNFDGAVADFLAGKPVFTDKSLPKGLRRLMKSLASPDNLPFSRELWTYNLSEHIRQVDEPILFVTGKKDIQVDWRVDGKALEDAMAARAGVSFVYPENANHLLKYEDKPTEKLNARQVEARYNAADARLDADAAGSITNWLRDRTGAA